MLEVYQFFSLFLSAPIYSTLYLIIFDNLVLESKIDRRRRSITTSAKINTLITFSIEVIDISKLDKLSINIKLLSNNTSVFDLDIDLFLNYNPR